MPRRGWSPRTRRAFVTGILFISPWILGFLTLTLYPMLVSLYYSLTEYHVKRPPVWIGLGNYGALLGDKLFWTALQNTGYMVVISLPLGILLPFLCAILLNLKVRGQSFYRVIYFLPSIVPVVANTLLWIWILNPSTGLMNSLLAKIGLNGPNWLADPKWSKPGLILMGLWGMGQTIVIYLSGLQDVPLSLLEAAELDGATWWDRLLNITVPMLSPITLFTLIMGVIGTFQYFAQAYILGGSLGAPLNSTLFYSVYLYHTAFRYLQMGYASAMAWILFIVIMVCTVLLLRSSEHWTYYAG